MNTLELLDRLIAFPTVSRDPNRELIEFVRQFLAERGMASDLYLAENGRKANLFATIGPADRPGVMLVGAHRRRAGRWSELVKRPVPHDRADGKPTGAAQRT